MEGGSIGVGGNGGSSTNTGGFTAIAGIGSEPDQSDAADYARCVANGGGAPGSSDNDGCVILACQ